MKKKLLAIATCLCMLTSLLPAVALAAEYSDTAGHWAEEDIARWSDAGVVQGSNGQFNPEGVMTRAEAAQVFANLLKLDGTADLSGYTDVPADAWYADAIAACVDKGILSGIGGGLMNPNGTITREMFFVMFARALGIPEETSLNGSFSDSGSISSWARGAVYALINRGYVSGTSANTVAPQLNINRASVMALLNQTIVSYIVTDGAVTVNSDGVVLVLADDVTLSGSGDVTVSVASAGAQVDLEGMTGEVAVVVLEDDVAITNAPEGTVITVADDATGTTVNGEAVAAGEEIVIPEEQPAPSGGGGGGGGGSTGGGGTPTPDPDPEPEPGDDDEEEQTPPTDDDEEQTPPTDDDEEEQVPPTDDDEEEQTPTDEDEEEQAPTDGDEDEDEAEFGEAQGGNNGANSSEEVI